MDQIAPAATAAPLTDHPALIRLIAVACGISVANLYYNQPLLADMAGSFHTTVAGVGAAEPPRTAGDQRHPAGEVDLERHRRDPTRVPGTKFLTKTPVTAGTLP